MKREHLTPTECDGTADKPVLTQNVRETVEYVEAMANPERQRLLDTMAELAAIGKRHIVR